MRPFRNITTATMLLVFTVYSISACSGPSRGVQAQTITAEVLLSQIKSSQDILVLDVRSPREFRLGHVPTAINIPHTYLEGRIKEIIDYKEKPVVVYCKVGARADIATGILLQAGFSNIRHLKGDMFGWSEARHPVEK